jgi:DNA-binding NarL/FixJ family response regulator
MATSRLAVQFGTVASGVLPQVLGDRLAQAIGGSLPFGGSSSALGVSVGMAAPEPHLHSSDITRRALSAAHLGRASATRTHDPNTVVTVDRLLAPRPSNSDPAVTFQSIHRRTVYRHQAEQIRSIRPLGAGSYLSAPVGKPAGPNGAAVDLSVLIVDAMATAECGPGLAATTAVSVTEHLGCRTAVATAPAGEPLALAVAGGDLDLVVLILDGGWVGHSPTWSSGTWGVPARLTASYRAKGIPVLAVSVGAGAGALASCVAQGALALFSLDLLPDALHSIRKLSGDEVLQVAELNQSARFRALVGLTISERRVLFYLTEGWAAQDIADELVVSLTTVRSHIRSVLRKLGVRSQLAAVAIANSRDLQHDAPDDL